MRTLIYVLKSIDKKQMHEDDTNEDALDVSSIVSIELFKKKKYSMF